MTSRPICSICKAEVEPGSLLSHERTHPRPLAGERKPYVCRQAKCREFYGPLGHMVGREGPHVY